jgi:hypothetical protein
MNLIESTYVNNVRLQQNSLVYAWLSMHNSIETVQ